MAANQWIAHKLTLHMIYVCVCELNVIWPSFYRCPPITSSSLLRPLPLRHIHKKHKTRHSLSICNWERSWKLIVETSMSMFWSPISIQFVFSAFQIEREKNDDSCLTLTYGYGYVLCSLDTFEKLLECSWKCITTLHNNNVICVKSF